MEDALHGRLCNGAESKCARVIGGQLDEVAIVVSQAIRGCRIVPNAAFTNLREEFSAGKANTRINGESLGDRI